MARKVTQVQLADAINAELCTGIEPDQLARQVWTRLIAPKTETGQTITDLQDRVEELAREYGMSHKQELLCTLRGVVTAAARLGREGRHDPANQ